MTKVKLSKLVENDYNPRKRFDDAKMQDLKESIEKAGLASPLTVRPIEDGEYEVVCGMRRFEALRELYSGNKQVPVNIRELDDNEARELSLIENTAREDLTPIEEGRFYADYVTVKVVTEDGETKEMTVLDAIEGGWPNLAIPSHNQNQVKSLSEKVGVGTTTIEKRMKLVTLPGEVQKAVEDGELSLQVAEEIFHLHQIPDAKYREQKMEDLAAKPVYRGDDPSVDQLVAVVSDLIEDYEKQEEEAKEKLEEFEEFLDERKLELQQKLDGTVKWLDERDVDTGDILDEEEIEEADYPVQAKSAQTVDWMQKRINSLGGGESDELQDSLSELETAKGRLERNLEIVKEENPERCPFCGAGVKAPVIEERISTIGDEMQGVQEKISEISEEQAAHRKKRKKLRKKLSKFEKARENYEEKKAEVKGENA